MPLPTLSDVHVSAPLTNLSVAYMQRGEKFKAEKISPLVPVGKQINKYFIFDKGDFHRDDAKERAPGTGFSRSGYNLSTGEYTCRQFSAEFVLPDENKANYDGPLGADRAAISYLNQKLLIRRERKFASVAFTTSVWGRDVAGHGSTEDATNHVYWDNASADIINSLHKQCDYVEEQTGFRPNRFITSPQVWRVMKNDPDIVARLSPTQGTPASHKQVAEICGIGSPENPGEIVIMNANYNSANEGATASMGFMIGDVGLLCYVAPSPQLEEPSALYTFSWSEFDFVKSGAGAVSSYRDENIKSDVYRAMNYFDVKIVANDCGVYYSNILT